MRNELEQIQTIEAYINGGMSASERVAFEERLSREPELREEVQLQREVMSGVERSALTAAVRRASTRFRRFRNFRNWGGGGLFVIAVVGVVFLLTMKKPAVTVSNVMHTISAAVNKINAPASSTVIADSGKLTDDGERRKINKTNPQTFSINVRADTVIRSKAGMVLSIPAGAFVNVCGWRVRRGCSGRS